MAAVLRSLLNLALAILMGFVLGMIAIDLAFDLDPEVEKKQAYYGTTSVGPLQDVVGGMIFILAGILLAKVLENSRNVQTWSIILIYIVGAAIFKANVVPAQHHLKELDLAKDRQIAEELCASIFKGHVALGLTCLLCACILFADQANAIVDQQKEMEVKINGGHDDWEKKKNN